MRKNLVIVLNILSFIIAKAGTVTGLIDYQYYRDFAMNKGAFKVGAMNVRVDRKDGSYRIINVPIPDFSSTDSAGVGTLINPNYVAGVKHNGGYKNVSYGYGLGHSYKLIDRNNHKTEDFHTPRLNKVVTDVAPSNWNSLDGNTINWAQNKDKYSIFARVGSGSQYTVTLNPDGTFSKKHLSGAYQYLTGGFYSPEAIFGGNLAFRAHGDRFFLDHNINTALPISVEGGDSGSPLWGFNSSTKQWELLGFAKAITAWDDIFTSFQKDFTLDIIKEDTSPDVINKNSNEQILWHGVKGDSNSGKGEIVQGTEKWEYFGLKDTIALNKATDEELNSTKHLTFKGEDGVIKLQDNINMGAGKLTFESNYTVTSENKDKTWVGAGIEIAKEKEVLWQVNGVKDDSLHKIGEGTLIVNGKGINEGALNVGDGTVVLNQESDESGKLQAFNKIDIVSGRATVILNNDEQIDTSKINFMFRGGRLDLNGNKIAFGDINAVDNGAKIINSSDKKAIADINTEKFKGNVSIFHGFFGESDENKKNGQLDVNISGASNKTFAITGGSNLDGDINLSGSENKLVLSGGRDLHAGENIKNTTVNGDYYFSKFKFKNLNLDTNTNFTGSVYSFIEGNINTHSNSNIILGYLDGKTDLVYDSTQNTLTQTPVSTLLNDKTSGTKFHDISTFYNGNINLNKNSNLAVGYTQIEGSLSLNSSNASFENSIFTGDIQGDAQSNLVLNNTYWDVSSTSKLGNLALNNTQLNFNSHREFNKTTTDFLTLSVDNISGNANVFFKTNLTTGEGDKLEVLKNISEGTNLFIDIHNVGKDMELGKNIVFMSLPDGSSSNLTLKSIDGENFIDLGPIRANLKLTDNKLVVSTPNLPVVEPKPPVSEPNPPIVEPEPPANQSQYASNLSNAAISEYTSRINLLKNQNELIHDRLNSLDGISHKEGVYYLGNYTELKFGNKNFRDYEQKIKSNGFGYDYKIISNGNSKLFIGGNFIYGKSDSTFDGYYNNKSEVYSLQIYSKFLTKDGYFIKGDYSKNLIKSNFTSYISEEKKHFDTDTYGLGLGKSYSVSNYKITPIFDTKLFTLPSNKYNLTDRHNDQYSVYSKKETLLQLKPSLTIEKSFNFNKLEILPSLTVGYEINKYLNNDNPEINVERIKFIAPMPKKGFEIKIGSTVKINENFNVGLEGKYLTGDEVKKKLSLELKFGYSL
ncbi:S6 family peptidase [Cetobacterium sp.]